MLHTHRCGNGCQHYKTDPYYPAGACSFAGVICKMEPRTREWVDVRGCGVYRAPKSDIVEVD